MYFSNGVKLRFNVEEAGKRGWEGSRAKVVKVGRCTHKNFFKESKKKLLLNKM